MSEDSLAPMVEYIAKAIANNPDEVNVEENINEDGVVELKLNLAQMLTRSFFPPTLPACEHTHNANE